MGLILCDTSFFVDLHREQRGKKNGAACVLLDTLGDAELAMSIITQGELARGFSIERQWRQFCHRFTTLTIDEPTLWQAAEAYQSLRALGIPIPDNDLWIAATAMRHEMPLVTRDCNHFSRIAGLELITYV